MSPTSALPNAEGLPIGRGVEQEQALIESVRAHRSVTDSRPGPPATYPLRPREMTDDELWTADVLVCRVCGAPVELGPALRAQRLRPDYYTLGRLRRAAECFGGHDWTRPCEHCGGLYRPPRSDGRYCSGRCRVAAHRRREADR